jgi:hypothetical protein
MWRLYRIWAFDNSNLRMDKRNAPQRGAPGEGLVPLCSTVPGTEVGQSQHGDPIVELVAIKLK